MGGCVKPTPWGTRIWQDGTSLECHRHWMQFQPRVWYMMTSGARESYKRAGFAGTISVECVRRGVDLCSRNRRGLAIFKVVVVHEM